MSITCGLCGRAILIDDPITLFVLHGDAWIVPQRDATIVFTNPPLLVGCYSRACANMMEVFFTGLWTPGANGEAIVEKMVTADKEMPGDRHHHAEVVDPFEEDIQEVREYLGLLLIPNKLVH